MDAEAAEQRGQELRRSVVAERDSLAEGGVDSEQANLRADSVSALARRLAGVRQRAYRLAGALNGAGVRQGSLYPPTRTQRLRMLQLEESLRRELATLEDEEGATR